LIIEHGTQEQIDRARKGGAGNSVSAIAKEIEYELRADEIKTCKKCGKTFPKSEFPPERAICKKCNKKRISEYQGKDFFGNKILIPKEIRVLTEEEIIGDLYNIEKEIEYTVDDLKDEISATIENFHWSISNCLMMHGDLLVDEKSKETVFKEVELLQEKLEGLKKLYGFV
jgi:hypothetical protein